MAHLKDPRRRLYWVQPTHDQFAFPEKPRGAVPDGDHLTHLEWRLMTKLAGSSIQGIPCMLADLELAAELGLGGSDQARRLRIKRLLNGQWVHGVRWPGLCDPIRGFILRKYAKGGRNARQLFAAEKWLNFRARKYRVVAASLHETTDQGDETTDQGDETTDQGVAPEKSPIELAATIAETYIQPPETGREFATNIRAGAGRFVRPAELPGVAWLAADRKIKKYGWIVACDRNGINPEEVKSARISVLKRAEQNAQARAAAVQDQEARQEAAQRRAGPAPPLTPDDVQQLREFTSSPIPAIRQMAAAKLREAGISSI